MRSSGIAQLQEYQFVDHIINNRKKQKQKQNKTTLVRQLKIDLDYH